MKRFWLVTVLLTLLISTGSAVAGPDVSQLLILSSVSRNGEINPCGCRGLDRGGLDREAFYIHKVEKETTHILKVDAGGFVGFGRPEFQELRAETILKGLKYMGYHAINIGEQDLRVGVKKLTQWQKELDVPLISANVYYPDKNQRVFPPYRLVEVGLSSGEKIKVGIVGIAQETLRRTPATPQAPRPTPTPKAGFELDSGTQERLLRGPQYQPAQETPKPTPKMPASLLPARPETPYGRRTTQRPQRSPAMLSSVSAQAAKPASGDYEIREPIAELKQLLPQLKKEGAKIILVLAHCNNTVTQRIGGELFDVDVVVGRQNPSGGKDNQTIVRTIIVSPGGRGRSLGRVQLDIDKQGAITKEEFKRINVLARFDQDPEMKKILEETKEREKKLTPRRGR